MGRQVLELRQANLIETKLLTANWIQYLLNINSTRRQRSNFRCGEFLKKAERKLLTSWDFWGLGTHWRNGAVECLTNFFRLSIKTREKKIESQRKLKMRQILLTLGQCVSDASRLSAFDGNFSQGWSHQSITDITSNVAMFTLKQA